jgi:hypothetical protein
MIAKQFRRRKSWWRETFDREQAAAQAIQNMHDLLYDTQ